MFNDKKKNYAMIVLCVKHFLNCAKNLHFLYCQVRVYGN